MLVVVSGVGAKSVSGSGDDGCFELIELPGCWVIGVDVSKIGSEVGS